MSDTSAPLDLVTVWCEIPVTDLERAGVFYAAVLQRALTISNDPPNPTVMIEPMGNSAGAHLYPGKPAPSGTGTTVHYYCPDALEAGMARVTEQGGSVLSEIISIPVGSFVYCRDPDGNSFGLFRQTAA